VTVVVEERKGIVGDSILVILRNSPVATSRDIFATDFQIPPFPNHHFTIQ
jgi:hypothetical protein